MNNDVNADIVQVMDSVFGAWFSAPSWSSWRVLLKAAFCLPMDDAELPIFRAATGRVLPPAKPCREVWVLVGRRGGKSLVGAMLAVYAAFFRNYDGLLAPGEVLTLQLVCADRRQARTLLRYVLGFIRGVPILAERLVSQTREGIEVTGIGGVRIAIEITTCSRVATRSYTLGFCANDELAFWPTSDLAAQPDVEVLTAQRPGLATIPFSMMFNISTGYARAGALYEAFEKHYGQDSSPTLFWKAPSRSLDPDALVQMNPSIDLQIVRAAYEQDSIAAASEWNGDFRSDVERLFTLEMLDSITDFDRPLILPPEFDQEDAFA